jgi:hypothetical protein
VALSNAVAARGASVLEAVWVGRHCMDQVKALGFAAVVRYSKAVAEPGHFAKVQVC